MTWSQNQVKGTCHEVLLIPGGGSLKEKLPGLLRHNNALVTRGFLPRICHLLEVFIEVSDSAWEYKEFVIISMKEYVFILIRGFQYVKWQKTWLFHWPMITVLDQKRAKLLSTNAKIHRKEETWRNSQATALAVGADILEVHSLSRIGRKRRKVHGNLICPGRSTMASPLSPCSTCNKLKSREVLLQRLVISSGTTQKSVVYIRNSSAWGGGSIKTWIDTLFNSTFI